MPIPADLIKNGRVALLRLARGLLEAADTAVWNREETYAAELVTAAQRVLDAYEFVSTFSGPAAPPDQGDSTHPLYRMKAPDA